MGSQRPECLSPDDDMPPAASSNRQTVTAVSNLVTSSSTCDDDGIHHVFTFTSSQTQFVTLIQFFKP